LRLLTPLLALLFVFSKKGAIKGKALKRSPGDREIGLGPRIGMGEEEILSESEKMADAEVM